jgi:hypothetical protein
MNLKTQPLTLAGGTLPDNLFARTLSALVTTAKDMRILSNKLNTEQETLGEWDEFYDELTEEFSSWFIQLHTDCVTVDDNVLFSCHVIIQSDENGGLVPDEISTEILNRINMYFA